ncbi:hypothetical protein BDW71DRAFT_80225 [Aspergillus fruticulosus]
MRSVVYLSTLAAFQLAAADQVGYFEANDCADPSGFASCYDDADEWWADCINENCEGQNIDCHNACECARQGAYTRCAAVSCWNMVYSCEYQLQVTDQINSCVNPNLDGIPFWPAPDNAAGRCSCSIGDLTTAQVLASEVLASCGDGVDPFTQSPDEIKSYGMGCLCCGWSGWLSSLDSFCPQLDPAELEMDNIEQFVAENITGVDWRNCQQWLSQYDCAAEFGYPSNIKAYYGPGDIPSGGTETLHNIGALTTPVSETITFTIGNDLYPVTAVSKDAHVPTSSSESDDTNNSHSTGSTADKSEESSADQTTEGGATPTDAAAHQAVVSKISLAFVVAILGLIYIL